MNIHLKGAFFLTQALLPLMADGGRIINLSSGLARFTLPGHAAYAAMKGGVASLLSDDNRWINGERIEASGGMRL